MISSIRKSTMMKLLLSVSCLHDKPATGTFRSSCPADFVAPYDGCVYTPTIGVLALQGDVREHLRTLGDLGVRPLPVRRPAELEACAGLVLPGGESTTMAKLARTFELFEPLQKRIAD